MFRRIGITRNFWVAVITCVVLGLLFAYYFMIYVKKREHLIHTEKTRELQRIGDNIEKLNKEVHKHAETERYLKFNFYVDPFIPLKTQIERKLLFENASFRQLYLIRPKNTPHNARTEVLLQNHKNRINLLNPDSLSVFKGNVSWSGIADIVVDKTEYKLFTQWLKLDGSDLLLCAIEKSSDIKSEAYAVEPWVIMNLICLIMFIIVVMPLMKLMIMNEVERLQMVNVFFSGVAIVLGTALLTLFLNFSNHYFGSNYLSLDNSLSTTSGAMRSNFLKEINEARLQLERIKTFNQDSLQKAAKVDSVPDSVKSSLSPIYQLAHEDPQLASILNKFKLFNEVIWIQRDGTIPLMFSSSKIDVRKTKLPNVKERGYFKAITRDSLWKSELSPGKPQPFYIDFVRSILSGKFQAVISTSVETNDDSDTATVAVAISTKPFSLQHSALPPGYHACIIDEKGEVKFHSDNARSLQENFLDEINFEPELVAAMDGRIAQHTSITYDKKPYRAYIHPLKDMPLHLVVFCSMESYKAPIILTVWFTCGLLLCMFFITIAHLTLLYSIIYHPSKLKIRRFFLGWLRPKKPARFRECYLQSLGGIFSLLLLYGLTLTLFPLKKEFIVGILLTPVFLLTFHFRLFADRENGEKRSTISNNVSAFTTWSIVLVIAIDAVALALFEATWFRALGMIAFQLLQVGTLAIPTSKFYEKINVYIFPNTGYKKLYLYAILLWLIAISIVPVFYFYKFSYEEESKIWLKHQQLDAARTYVMREATLKPNLEKFSSAAKDIRSMGNYQNVIGETLRLRNSKTFPKATSDSSRYSEFLFNFTPPLNDLINLSGAQAFNQSTDDQWFWKQSCDTVKLYYRSGQEKTCDLTVASAVPIYSFCSGRECILFWITIVILVLVASRTIRFTLRSIYGFDIVRPMHEVVLSADFFKFTENTRKNFFMVGLPYSGKGKILREFIDNHQDQIYRINLQTDIERIPQYQGQRILIIEHFEFGMNNHELNKLRLKLLQSFQARPNVQVILSSTVQPTAILDYYDRMENLCEHLKEKVEFKSEYAEYKHAKRYWRSVLSGFVVIYVPLNPGNEGYVDQGDLSRTELSHGTFLRKLKSHVANQPMDTFPEREDFVLKVEDMANAYYQSLWNSFSNAEKRLLYDLALDRFVNMKNINVIRILLQKGVLVISNSLQIFNKSFNNFILSVVKEDEEIIMQEEMRTKGAWNSVQLVLILIFIATGVFIALAQRDILQNFNALMTALGGVTALLLRFGGLFSIGSRPKE